MPRDPVTTYARAALAGETGRPIGALERAAYQRHVDDLVHGPSRGLTWDPAAARFAINWFPTLKHRKGRWAGQPIVLEGWQEFVVGCVFGWKNADGARRFNQAYEEVGRKNGKSTKAAGVGLELLLVDGEPGAEVYTLATKEDQAKIVFEEAAWMAGQHPAFGGLIDVKTKSIFFAAMQSVMRPLGADSDTQDGLNVHGAVVDEMAKHKTRALLDVIASARGSRSQSLIWIITTAGDFDEESPGWQEHEYAVQILTGAVVNDAVFAIIYALDDGDDWADEASWPKANPNLEVSVSLKSLRDDCRKALTQPAYQHEFRTKACNQWVNQADAWIDMKRWHDGGAPFDPAILDGLDCYVADDLATRSDIAASCYLFPPQKHLARWHALWRFYAPAEAIARAIDDKRYPYGRWRDAGWLTETPGAVTDFAFIRADHLAMRARYNILQLGYDPWNAESLRVQLETEDGFTCVELRQGMKTMSAPSKEFERLVAERLLAHGGNPVMTWMVSNARVERDTNGNFRPVKGKDNRKKIDGVVALIMALALATAADRDARIISIPEDYEVAAA